MGVAWGRGYGKQLQLYNNRYMYMFKIQKLLDVALSFLTFQWAFFSAVLRDVQGGSSTCSLNAIAIGVLVGVTWLK